MPVELDVNGVEYSYPAPGDQDGWGTDATAWAEAVTLGMLQKQGGSFTLTAEVDFGGSFGLIAAYLKTHSANPASAGVLRLGKDDSMGWRNPADDGDLLFSIDDTGTLLFNGSPFGGTGTVTSVDLTMPGIFSVTGNPITVSGTLAVALATETANRVFAGPTTGSAAVPAFRALVAADIPSLSYLSSALASAKIFVGNISGVATAVTVTGDVTNDNAGVTTIGNNKVTNAKLATVAANTLKGNNTGSTANAADLTIAQVNTLLTVAEVDTGNSGTSKTIDLSAGPAQKSTLTGSVTYTLSNGLSGAAYVIRIVQGSGSYTVTWPASVLWAGGTPPTISTANGAIDVINLYFDGTHYYGTFAQAFA